MLHQLYRDQMVCVFTLNDSESRANKKGKKKEKLGIFI